MILGLSRSGRAGQAAAVARSCAWLSIVAVVVAATACARTPGPTPATPAPAAQVCPWPAAVAPHGLDRRSYDARLFARGAAPDGTCAIANPERGFFAFRDLLAMTELDGLHAEGITLVYGRVLLAPYRNRGLDAALLGKLEAGFAAVRRAGLKVLPRFYYAADDKAPDAPPARALEHITALAPTLRANADVIAALHAGFVGAWGEWHPEERASSVDRRAILTALLEALPATRAVMVRRPFYKKLAFGGPLSALAQGTPLARLGHLNDCFLASDNDMGTYRTTEELGYALADAPFAVVGGETCAPNSPRSDCATALDELARHHFSFLNRDYHGDVLASWRAGGCYDQIACRLGYRFVLRAVSVGRAVKVGQPLPIAVELGNDGFARPINPRPVYLALAAGAGPPVLLPTGVDARAWAPGDATLCASPVVPELAPGAYRVGIALPDPEPSLAADPRYAVRLIGGVSFDAGINWLETTVTVEP